MYLLDTVVVSEMRKRVRHPSVIAWFGSISPRTIHVSVLTIAEIEYGIERRRSVDSAFASMLSDWLQVVLLTFGDRTLPITTPIARIWGRLAKGSGRLDADGGIAATAIAHDLTVVTRNVRHFDGSGAKILNPFEG